ncbi:MAG: hypothetical protein ACRDIB_10615, partial [Ardenticatenaceae bacterium]
EYILADGEVYKRLDAGPWQVLRSQYQWESWVDVFGGLPSPVLEALNARSDTSEATLKSLAQSFDDYERLPDTEIDGIAVSHFRANTISWSDGFRDVPQTVDIWIDKDSGLPVKILLEARQPFGQVNESTLEFYRERFQRIPNPPRDRVKDLPIVVRQTVNEMVLRSEFTFVSFNEDVEISAPVPE